METKVKAKKNKDLQLSKAAAIMASKSASPEERKQAAAVLGRAGGKHSVNSKRSNSNQIR